MMPNGSTQFQPPAQFLHPLCVLDEYLLSLPNGMDDNDPNKEGGHRTTLERRSCVLQVADFLYGGSILEAALAVLETENDCVRRIVSEPSQRSAFLVKGMSRTDSRSSSSAVYYFCLVPVPPSLERSETHPKYTNKGIYYCSCRSYYERAKQDPLALCKHLLALKLMDSLECPCREEIVSDAKYATLLMNRIFDI